MAIEVSRQAEDRRLFPSKMGSAIQTLFLVGLVLLAGAAVADQSARQLPDGFPRTVALPENITVIHSRRYGEDGIVVRVDSNLSLDELLIATVVEMERRDWKVVSRETIPGLIHDVRLEDDKNAITYRLVATEDGTTFQVGHSSKSIGPPGIGVSVDED